MAPASSRIAARLADLSHAQLLEIAAAGCDASTEVKNRADALLAAHKPLAQWAVEEVLLSSDLVPHLLAPLQLDDGAAAAVCSRWAEGWKATSEGRRRLRRVPLDFPRDLLGIDSLNMVVAPGGDELVVRSGHTVCILGRDMSSTGISFELPTYKGEIAASEEFIYASAGGREIRCYNHAGTEVAKYEEPEKAIVYSVLGPGGQLFCLLSDMEDPAQNEIIDLDARTLQLRHRFGLSHLNSVGGMVVAGEELFVCDTWNDRLQVFSLAGEHRRSITGEWDRPEDLCFVKDRLYLVEMADYMYEEDEEGELNPAGRRIFMLSLQGETLDVYPDLEGQAFVSDRLCCFDGKLLAPVRDMVQQEDDDGIYEYYPYLGVISLAGA